MKKNIIVSEEQLRMLSDKVKTVKEDKRSHSMAKKQLFTISTLANKMWEEMDDNEQLEDWQESKIAQAEQSIIAVVKSFMYDEFIETPQGLEGINLDDIVIGQ
tara:strand:+ start:908 stop:1216 length:309 start_codon:yes stop_codon:yes gene_type:complete